MDQFCFPKDLYLKFVSIWYRSLFSTSAIMQSLLFDLAPFKSEAGASSLFTLQSDTVNIRVCVCVSVTLCCVLAFVCVCVSSESVKRMPGYWGQACVGRSVRKPPPFPPSCRERKNESKRILDKSFYWSTGVVYLTPQSENTPMKQL